MKKLFTLIACALLTLGASAAETALDLIDLGSGWSSSYDAATKTITYESAWTGRGWWFGDKDYTGYTKVVIETEALPGTTKVVVEYANDVTSTEGIANQGDTKIEALISEEGAGHVKQIYIQSGVAGTITLTNAYISGEAVDLSKIWEGSSSFGINWDWDKTLGFAGSAFANVKSGDSLVLTYTQDSESDYWQLKVLFGQWGNQTHSMPSALTSVASAEYDTFEATGTSYSIALTDDDIATLKKDGLRISGYNVTLTKISTSQGSTGISAAPAAKASADAPIYNLKGQKVDKNYKGIKVQNGKKFM